jgi:predicted DNA-binding transcriptional regulator YafY
VLQKFFSVYNRGENSFLPPTLILFPMSRTMPRKRDSRHVHLHAYERLNRLCAEIQRGRYPTKAVLARVVELSKRTVQHDLRALVNDFGAPLEFDRTRNGFYFTDPAWRLPAIALTEGELIGFFAAERMLRRLGAASEVQLARSALRRLAALLPQEVVVDLSALEEAISFAPEPVLDASPEVLRKLATAAMHRQTLYIQYYSQYRAIATEREVDVLLLHNSLGEWYAICYDHLRRDIRDFHAGRITHIANTRRTFTPPVGWDAQAYLRRGFGMFRGGQDVVVEVEFDPEQARYARERSLRLTFETAEAALEQVARWLMQYGVHAKALRPPALRALVRQQLRQAIGLYDQDVEEVNDD